MKSILSNKNFSLILSGKLVSLLGNAVYQISLIWYVLSLPGETNGKMLTWIMVLSLLPAVLLGGMLGGVVDRYNKKYIIVISDIISGITVLIIAFLLYHERLSFVHILIATSILSMTTSALSIAVRSLIPEILSYEELQIANSSNQFVERFTSLIGLLFGGMLVGFVGVKEVFLLNGISFLLSAVFEMFIHYTPQNNTSSTPESKYSPVDDFKIITNYLKNNKDLLTLMLIFTFVNFLWDPLFAVVVPYTLKNDFHVTPVQFGAIEASLGLGFCLAAIYFSKNGKFIENPKVLFQSILGVNTVMVFFSLPIFFKSIASQIPFMYVYFMITLMIGGIFSAGINISVATYLQKTIPNHLRGKFYGVSTSFSLGLIPLSGILMGNLIGKIDSSFFFIISSALVYLMLVCVPTVASVTKHLIVQHQ